jgi:hypothetical protein
LDSPFNFSRLIFDEVAVLPLKRLGEFFRPTKNFYFDALEIILTLVKLFRYFTPVPMQSMHFASIVVRKKGKGFLVYLSFY